MITGISFSDVLKIPEFNGLNQFDLLPRKMDSRVLPYLYLMGADVDKVYSVQACLHRPIGSTKPIMGYRYSLMERTDREWVTSRAASLAALIASQTDNELKSDLIRMSSQGMNWDNMRAQALSEMTASQRKAVAQAERCDKYEPEPDYEERVAEMMALRSIQEAVRGPLVPADEDLFAVF